MSLIYASCLLLLLLAEKKRTVITVVQKRDQIFDWSFLAEREFSVYCVANYFVIRCQVATRISRKAKMAIENFRQIWSGKLCCSTFNAQREGLGSLFQAQKQ
jgi:hypothetical protein